MASAPRRIDKGGWGRYPVLHERYLTVRNSWRRRTATDIVVALALVLFASAAMWMANPQLRALTSTITTWIDRYEIVLTALAGVHGAMLVSRQRLRETALQRTSWLAAVPVDAVSIRISILIGTALAAAMHLAVILFALTAIAGLAGISPIRPSTWLIFAGFVSGSLIGWYWRSRKSTGFEASRYAPKLHSHSDRLLSSGRGMSYWPIAQTLAWHRPENAKIVLLAALMAVQGGSSMAIGLCVVGAWLIAIYLATLLHATVHTGRAAATWLMSTPIGFVQFAWPIAKLVLLHECIGALVAAAMGAALGAPLATIAYLAILWITIVVVASAVSLADSYRHQRHGFKLVLSMTGFAAVETRAHGWAIPVAIAVAAWHIKSAIHSQKNAQ